MQPPDQREEILANLKRELDLRRAQNQLAQYRPYAKQAEFHEAGAIEGIRERLLKAGNQLGKASLNSTPVLTPTGWVCIADLKVGDQVVAGDGTATNVIGVYPQGVKPMYRLTFDQGQSTVCCGEHLWKFQHPAARFKTRQDRRGKRPNKRYGEWMVADVHAILDMVGPAPTPRRRVITPYVGQVQFSSRPVSLQPYLLGALLGDGSITGSSIRITKPDEEIIERVRSELPPGAQMHYLGRHTHSIKGFGQRNPVLTALRELKLMGCDSFTKFIPHDYLFNDADTRLNVLRGLLDTDGHVSTDGAIEYTTTSVALRDGVMFLVQSFGGKCKYTERCNSYSYLGEKRIGALSYRLRIRLPHVVPFYIGRKVERLVRPVSTCDEHVLYKIELVEPGECTCIAVDHPERTFVIEHFLVTHNTYSAAFETAYHLTGRYPIWWNGKRFDKPVTGWGASLTSQVTRDTIQRLLVGLPGSWGQNCAIPKDALGEIKRSTHGVADAIESINVKHESGGISRITLKSYDQGRERFQGETLNFCWLDEEPPLDIYTEALTRTQAVQGILWMTFTPLLGMSDVVKRYLNDKVPGTHVTNMTIYDAEHYTDTQRAAIIAGYPTHEREARAMGTPMLGSGRIFPIDEALIKESPPSIPGHWARICGIDFGFDHPTAAAWIAWDRDTDTFHVYDTYRAKNQPIAVHAAAIKARGDWIPVAWPHDGLQHEKGSGETIAFQYRKHGLNMLKDRATFDDGGNGVEAGIQEMYDLMLTGRFKVAKHLTEFFEEFRMFHRKDGKIVKLNDDIISSVRYALMMRRKAKARALPDRQRMPAFVPLDAECGY